MDIVTLAASRKYTDKKIAESAAVGIKYEIVDSLPSSGEAQTIYFVKNDSSWINNYYDEYVWISSSGSFEKIGSTQLDDFIQNPSAAEVGQTIVVKEVNEEGKPIAWEMADLPEQVQVDATLTQSGQAADAAVVGQKFSELSEEKVTGVGITEIMAITQADYDELVALEKVSETTLYIITDHTESPDGSGGGSGGSTENLIPYLESDGTAYIKLGIAPIDGASYEVCFRASDGIGKGIVFGNRWTNICGAGGSATKQWMCGYYNGSAYATFGSSYLDVSKKHIYTITNSSLVLDNDFVTEITAGTNTKTSIMYLFAQNSADTNNGEYLAGMCAFTFFYLKIRNADGDLLYNYLPAQDSDGVSCVYEAVNKTYLYNAADSGTFTYGEELEES